MNLRFNSVLSLTFAVALFATAALSQKPAATPALRPNVAATPAARPDTAATPAVKKEEKKVAPAPTAKKDVANKTLTAEQIAESVILIYGFPGGRTTLNQIRKTSVERGQSNVRNADGKVDPINYQRWIVRAETLDKEKIRLDQELPNARYSLVFNDDKIFGIFNNSVFAPKDEASKYFENQIVRGIEALLRYKENGSTLELAGREKIMNVDLYKVAVTDKQNRKTRFYVSAKTFRIMMLEYEDAGVKYLRKFYNYNYAQGTLVPYRSVLWADGRVVEETEISTIRFGQKVDEDLFKAG